MIVVILENINFIYLFLFLFCPCFHVCMFASEAQEFREIKNRLTDENTSYGRMLAWRHEDIINRRHWDPLGGEEGISDKSVSQFVCRKMLFIVTE